MCAAVRADEFALIESHIGLVRQRHRLARFGVSSGTGAAKTRESYEAIEIRDVRGIVDVSQWPGWWSVMYEGPEGL